jgi:hypothetical protein
MFQTLLILASEYMNYCCIKRLLNNILICFICGRTGWNFPGRLNMCGGHNYYTVKEAVCGCNGGIYGTSSTCSYCSNLAHCSTLLCDSCVRHSYSVYQEEFPQFFHICSRSKYCLVTVSYNSNN